MTVAVQTSVEVLTAEPVTPRALDCLQAFTRSAPAELCLRQTTTYAGGADWLLLWGPGESVRAAAIRHQVSVGKHAIALDLAYWSRERKTRVTIDAPHPQAWVMRRQLPVTRLAADRPPTASLWTAEGPIIIAGIGCKARKQYGADRVTAWEDAMATACRTRFPTQAVIRRQKKPVTVSIEQALRGASLLITWHSNAAVDAIRMGIPVVCRDGAAAAVCPSDVRDDHRPLPIEVRDQFLANLAWFQWDLHCEAGACWTFLQETLT